MKKQNKKKKKKKKRFWNSVTLTGYSTQTCQLCDHKFRERKLYRVKGINLIDRQNIVTMELIETELCTWVDTWFTFLVKDRRL